MRMICIDPEQTEPVYTNEWGEICCRSLEEVPPGPEPFKCSLCGQMHDPTDYGEKPGEMRIVDVISVPAAPRKD
jgi:hypothetical protein